MAQNSADNQSTLMVKNTFLHYDMPVSQAQRRCLTPPARLHEEPGKQQLCYPYKLEFQAAPKQVVSNYKPQSPGLREDAKVTFDVNCLKDEGSPAAGAYSPLSECSEPASSHWGCESWKSQSLALTPRTPMDQRGSHSGRFPKDAGSSGARSPSTACSERSSQEESAEVDASPPPMVGCIGAPRPSTAAGQKALTMRTGAPDPDVLLAILEKDSFGITAGRPMKMSKDKVAEGKSSKQTQEHLPKLEVQKSEAEKAERKEEKLEFMDPEKTTVMLRNLPNNYTRDMFLTMLDKAGFSGDYDFVYLPVDFHRRAGLGYAFVNLKDTTAVSRFWDTFHGFKDWVLPTSKVGQVGWSGPFQGLKAHLERYRNSPVMHPSVPDEFKPVLFEGGVRVSFPKPTKVLRPPSSRS